MEASLLEKTTTWLFVRMCPSLSRTTPLPPPAVLDPSDATMLTVEGRTFFAVSATPVTVDELLILELTDPREELEEEEPAEAVKDPTPAPTPPPTRAASTAAVRTTPPP